MIKRVQVIRAARGTTRTRVNGFREQDAVTPERNPDSDLTQIGPRFLTACPKLVPFQRLISSQLAPAASGASNSIADTHITVSVSFPVHIPTTDERAQSRCPIQPRHHFTETLGPRETRGGNTQCSHSAPCLARCFLALASPWSLSRHMLW